MNINIKSELLAALMLLSCLHKQILCQETNPGQSDTETSGNGDGSGFSSGSGEGPPDDERCVAPLYVPPPRLERDIVREIRCKLACTERVSS